MARARCRFGWSTLGGIVAAATRNTAGELLFCLSLTLLPLAAQTRTIEHPGILHKEDNCSSCHADKTRGKSVHSAMEVVCTVCHLAQTQGDMTTLTLSLPKEEICFSCHEKSMMQREHPTAVQKLCVDCHDAHSSNRRMLLLEPANINHRDSSLMLPGTRVTTHKPASQP